MMAAARALFARQFVRDTLVLQAARVISTILSAVTSLIVWRALGPAQFGAYALAESFFALWTQLDLTGAAAALYTRLGIAIGARDDRAMRAALGAYLKIGAGVTLVIAALVIGSSVPVAAALYGDGQIGVLAAGLAAAWIADVGYGCVLTIFGAARRMDTLALLSVLNQIVLTACFISAAVFDPTAGSLVVARVVYAYSTLILALVMFESGRRRGMFPAGFPGIREMIQTAIRAPVRGYWRFGAANAIDKNLSGLFVQLPLQLVGVIAGASAASYVSLALSAITNAGILTSAVFENVQAVVPQAVGRGDFVRLRRNIARVMIVLGVGALGVYGALALVAPFVIPPLLGEEWTPAVPALVVLTVYGGVTAVGGVLGPLYRAFGRIRAAIAAKIIALLAACVVGVPWIVLDGAVGGARMIAFGLSLSVLITAVWVLPNLWKRNQTQTE